MNIRRTIAAVITAAACALSLTACGKDEQPIMNNNGAGNTLPGGNNKPSVNNGGAGYMQGIDDEEMALEIERTHVRVCQSTAADLYAVTKTYCAEYIAAVSSANGYSGKIYSGDTGILAEITVVNGAATVRINGYNDAAITDKYELGTYEDYIKEQFEFTSEDNCKAVILAKKDGKPCACVYSDRADAKLGDYEYDAENDKITVKFEWVSKDLPGVTPDGFYIGTYPYTDNKGVLTA